jgi:hypothetical protein
MYFRNFNIYIYTVYINKLASTSVFHQMLKISYDELIDLKNLVQQISKHTKFFFCNDFDKMRVLSNSYRTQIKLNFMYFRNFNIYIYINKLASTSVFHQMLKISFHVHAIKRYSINDALIDLKNLVQEISKHTKFFFCNDFDKMRVLSNSYRTQNI